MFSQESQVLVTSINSFEQFVSIIVHHLMLTKVASLDYTQTFGPLFQQAARWPVPEVVKLREWLDEYEIPRLVPQFSQLYDRHVQPTLNRLRKPNRAEVPVQALQQPGAVNKAMKSHSRSAMSEDEEPPRQVQRLANGSAKPVIQQPRPPSAPRSTTRQLACSTVVQPVSDQSQPSSHASSSLTVSPSSAPSVKQNDCSNQIHRPSASSSSKPDSK